MSDEEKRAAPGLEGAPQNRRLGNRAIGDRLRQMYEGVVEEPVPNAFLKLLEEAEANEKDASSPEGCDGE